jgi:hypothetical protein
MEKFEECRKQILKIILGEIEISPDFLAAWEGGSTAATPLMPLPFIKMDW